VHLFHAAAKIGAGCPALLVRERIYLILKQKMRAIAAITEIFITHVSRYQPTKFKKKLTDMLQ
jgi:hypothetical protein